ncbi:MAG TPA: hypothetical protein VGQ92_21460 [Actinoplanes sp.]|nr:hypothetical protein [Actinoplanes sp.]
MRWSLVRDNPLVVVLLAGFVGGRLAVWFREPVFPTPDSPSYRGGDGLTLADVLSFGGHAPRLWGTPLFYAIFPGDGARALAQWTVGTLAWSVLAVVLYAQLRSTSTRVVAAAAVLVLGLLPEVTNWDFAIMSESLSISLGVAVLALLIWFLRSERWPALVALTITAFWWTFVRPEIRLMVGFLILVLASYAVLRKARRRGVVVAAAVLVVAVGWVTAITPVMDRTYAARAWNGLSLTEATFVYRLRHQIMPNHEVMAVYQRELGMPDCPAAERIAKVRAWETSQFFRAYLSCPDMVAWGQQNAGSSGYRFALADPSLYARETLRVLPASLSGEVNRGSAVLPEAVERAVFPPQRVVLDTLAGGYLSALVVAAVAGAFRRRKVLVYTSLGVFVASVVSIFAELMYSAGDYVRFGIQEAVFIRLAIVLTAIAAIDALIGRLRNEAPARALPEPATAAALPEPATAAALPEPVEPSEPAETTD